MPQRGYGSEAAPWLALRCLLASAHVALTAARPSPPQAPLKAWVAKCFSLCTTSLERTAMQKQVKDKVEDAAEVRETYHGLGSLSLSLSLSLSPSLSLSLRPKLKPKPEPKPKQAFTPTPNLTLTLTLTLTFTLTPPLPLP